MVNNELLFQHLLRQYTSKQMIIKLYCFANVKLLFNELHGPRGFGINEFLQAVNSLI